MIWNPGEKKMSLSPSIYISKPDFLTMMMMPGLLEEAHRSFFFIGGYYILLFEAAVELAPSRA